MGISIRNAAAERKLRRVAKLLGKTVTETVVELADGKLKEIEARRDRERQLRKVEAIVRRVKRLPVLSSASEDEILGYNKDGLFD
jgi:hypothetical protein